MISLQANRLKIRDLSSSDIDNIHNLHSSAETDRFNTLGIPESIQTTEKLVAEWLTAHDTLSRTSNVYCIELKDSNQFIGLIALNLRESKFRSAEVWFKIHPNHWNNGYATEALTKTLNFGFQELNLHRIEAGCAVENTGSIMVMEKVGMIREGLKRKILPIRGKWADAYSYAILKEEFIKVSTEQKDLLKAIGLILWNDWDPIGVNQYSEIKDEYDSYILKICSLIFSSDPVDKITHELYEIETNKMGLTGSFEHCKKIAEKIVSIVVL
jgi:RimJ/RimL family protein N-acetyltransferase